MKIEVYLHNYNGKTYMAILNLQDENTVNYVWNKGLVIDGYNPELYRQDYSGAWISRNAYGNRDSILGWEIDHVYPTAKGGTDDEINLRPINWRNNISKGDNYPEYIAAITAEENKNVEKETRCTVGRVLQAKLKELYNL